MAPWLRSRLRQAIGWIAAYALVLQTTLAAFALPPLATTDPSLAFDPAAIICVTADGVAHAVPPDEPGGSGHTSHLGGHCGLCAVSAPVLAELIATEIDQLAPARSYTAPPAADQVASLASIPLPGRPRAPPAIA